MAVKHTRNANYCDNDILRWTIADLQRVEERLMHTGRLWRDGECFKLAGQVATYRKALEAQLQALEAE